MAFACAHAYITVGCLVNLSSFALITPSLRQQLAAAVSRYAQPMQSRGCCNDASLLMLLLQAADARQRIDARRRRQTGFAGSSAPAAGESGADSLRGRLTVAAIAASSSASRVRRGYRDSDHYTSGADDTGDRRRSGAGSDDGPRDASGLSQHGRDRYSDRRAWDTDGRGSDAYRAHASPLASAGAFIGGRASAPLLNSLDTRMGGSTSYDGGRRSGGGGDDGGSLAEQRRRLELQREALDLELHVHRLQAQQQQQQQQQQQLYGGFPAAFGSPGPSLPFGSTGGAFFPPFHSQVASPGYGVPWGQQQHHMHQQQMPYSPPVMPPPPPPPQLQPLPPAPVDNTAAAAAAVTAIMRSTGAFLTRPPAAVTGGSEADAATAAAEDSAIASLSALPPHLLSTDVAQRQLRLLLDRRDVSRSGGRRDSLLLSATSLATPDRFGST